MRRRKALLLSAVAFFLVAAACGCHIWKEAHQKAEEQQAFEQLEEQVVLPKPTNPPALESTSYGDQEIAVHDAAALQSSNSDFIGWLSIPGTVISYPVMCSPSEPERYLHRDFYGRNSFSGTPFLDARCDLQCGNLIIYGHNMNNGSMFGTLKLFRDKNYMLSHPHIYLELSDGIHVFEILSAATLQQDDPWYCFLQAADNDEEQLWISELRSKPGIHIDTTPTSGERLLTLSTCNGSQRNQRTVVVAKEMEGAT